MTWNAKPKFAPFETWGACSRCGARVAYNTLARERATGLLVCTHASGRPVAPCLDKWPELYDFQVFPDRSIEPPAEPLPTRWGLDNIFSAATFNDVSAGTPRAYANAPKAAPDDATRVQALLRPAPYTMSQGVQDFSWYRNLLNQNQDRDSVVTVAPAAYDGTFVPSRSVRTVTPPASPPSQVGVDANGDWLKALPWAAAKGV